MNGWGKLGLFAGGILFGTAGVGILKSKDAKKVYTHCTAAVLRGRESVMTVVTNAKENCSDIYEDAKKINEDRKKAEEEKVFEDESEEKQCAETDKKDKKKAKA